MFPGFPPDTLKFLRALKRNNNREWFQARKETFDSKVMVPMLALIDEVNQAFFDFAPHHATPPKRAVYRIYRDTRFSSDKTPYKTHVAAIFPSKDMERHVSAGYYFHISPEHVGVAAGAYMPGPEQLLAIRTWLVVNHARFVTTVKKAEKAVGPMQGATLARSPKGFDPQHPAQELIRRKQWYFWKEFPPDLATSAKLQPELIRYFRAAAPVIELINAPLRKPKKEF